MSPHCKFKYSGNMRWHCQQNHCKNYIKAGPDADPQKMYAKCQSPGGIPPLVDCIHRGKPFTEVECRLCGMGKTAPVYECKKHGACTLRKYKAGRSEYAVCFLCPDREEWKDGTVPN